MAVDLPPVVGRVDDQLAVQWAGGDAAVLAEWEGEDNQVSLGGGIGGGGRDRTRGEDLSREGDPLGAARPGDEHPIAGRNGQSSEHGAELAGAEDAERHSMIRRGAAHAVSRSWSVFWELDVLARMSRTMGITVVPYSSTARRRALTGSSPTV